MSKAQNIIITIISLYKQMHWQHCILFLSRMKKYGSKMKILTFQLYRRSFGELCHICAACSRSTNYLWWCSSPGQDCEKIIIIPIHGRDVIKKYEGTPFIYLIDANQQCRPMFHPVHGQHKFQVSTLLPPFLIK